MLVNNDLEKKTRLNSTTLLDCEIKESNKKKNNVHFFKIINLQSIDILNI